MPALLEVCRLGFDVTLFVCHSPEFTTGTGPRFVSAATFIGRRYDQMLATWPSNYTGRVSTRRGDLSV